MRKRLAAAVATAVAGTVAASVLVAAPMADAASTADVPAAGSVPADQDPFYDAPADIASYRPGQVVDSRPVPVKLLGLPMPVDAWQISFRSNDSHDRAELAVTTLVVPKSAWSGAGSRPVVSLQSPEDSTGASCAPSQSIANGTAFQEAGLGLVSLLSNWAVALPDHEGPRSTFMAGANAGHIVLDGIRAVKNFNAAGIGSGNKWALSGYSGGANATGWAAELQPTYAPELKIAGAAMGGTPAEPAAVAHFLDGGFAAGFEFAAAYGLATEFPEAGIQGLLNDRGREDFAFLDGACEVSILARFPFHRLDNDTSVEDPLSVPSVAAVLKKNTMGSQAPSIPVYDYHAVTDEIVPVGQDNTLVRNWCARGATVQKVRDLLGEHVEEAVVRTPSTQKFLADRFAGKPAVNSC